MVINAHKLKQNEKAIEKYRLRTVKIFHSTRNVWLFVGGFVMHKREASVYLIGNALNISKKYTKEDCIEFHFEDDLGEEKLSISDFDQESVYNCPNIVFENERPKQAKS